MGAGGEGLGGDEGEGVFEGAGDFGDGGLEGGLGFIVFGERAVQGFGGLLLVNGLLFGFGGRVLV